MGKMRCGVEGEAEDGKKGGSYHKRCFKTLHEIVWFAC